MTQLQIAYQNMLNDRRLNEQKIAESKSKVRIDERKANLEFMDYPRRYTNDAFDTVGSFIGNLSKFAKLFA